MFVMRRSSPVADAEAAAGVREECAGMNVTEWPYFEVVTR